MGIHLNDKVVDGKLIPTRVQLETFYGCNARCTMCAISKPATRRIGPMSMEMFTGIVDSLVPYKDHIEKIDLFALGEPLLDVLLFERIAYLKNLGFKGLCISTNAHPLYEDKQRKLLEAGIDTVIFSIDGATKATHEAIRVRTKFDVVVENCQSMIRLRDEGNYATRFVMRFIRQASNKDEWEPFRAFWEPKLSSARNDLLIVYDVNGMGGEIFTKSDLLREDELDPAIEALPCHQVFDRMIVLADGSIPLCCEDSPKAEFNFGNVKDKSPLEHWNSQRFKDIRETHLQGKKNDIPFCANCTMLYSEAKMKVITPAAALPSEAAHAGEAAEE